MRSRPKIRSSCLLAAACLAVWLAGAALPVAAQPNVDRLKQPKAASGATLVAQNGRAADDIRATLKRIALPPGFRIDLYAIVPDARHMAVAANTNLVFVGTRKTTVWAVTNRSGGDAATDVRPFAPGVKFRNPNGVCWTTDGVLIVAEQNRVLAFPGAESFGAGPQVAFSEVVGQGKLVPPEEESPNHGARTCRVGPDGKLYITLGQPFNVPPRSKLKLYREWGIGGIVRMNVADGSQREVYASGLRNSVGQDFNPKDGTLWFTDNQTDGMGDDIPEGEINRATRAGQFFGYPWTNGRTRITEEGYDKDPLPADIVDPQVYTQAHAADLGMAFYGGRMFPAKYHGGFFSAQHGSWNRSVPVGAQVLFTSLKADGTADRTEVFAAGWLDAGAYRGRPVDVAPMKDGSLLISDDFAGAIYRVTYTAP